MSKFGIDIGGTRIKYGIVNGSDVSDGGSCATPSGYEAVLARIIEISSNALATHDDITGIGLSVPGVMDPSSGVVYYSNNLEWSNVHLSDDLTAAVKKPVMIANDAHCAGLAEALFGAGRGFSRTAMITIGTGVGGAFVKDGCLESDIYGSMAYIFGHSVLEYKGTPCNCGRKGCFEAYSSAGALLRELDSSDIGIKSVEELFAKAREGNTEAERMVCGFVDMLGAGTVNIANILRPQIIIIGGGVSASADLIIPRLSRILEAEVYGYKFAPVVVAAAELGNNAGVIGAANLK